MTTAERPPVPPVAMTLLTQAGRLEGSNARYEKFLPDLQGLYCDSEAYEAALADDDGRPVYWVESSRTEDGPGGLITGISVLEPGTVGAEYVMTRGHLHAIADRSELYLGLSGRGVMILDTVEGESRVVEINPGEAVYVPGHWVHRSVNVGTERLVTLFCYAADAGQDYSIIERAGGMASLVLTDGDGWRVEPNPDHRGYVRTPA
jgi:glucose-6-phosphate isomerase